MKRILTVALSLAIVTALIFGVSAAMAAKPQKAIEVSNGYPSGPHYNLNIHGKNDGFNCVLPAGCSIKNPELCSNSVFIPEYGSATITYITDRRHDVPYLIVTDPGAVQDGTAEVRLPYERDGYYVLARIKGKPDAGNPNEKKDLPSTIILTPGPQIMAGDYWNDILVGLVLTDGVYQSDGETFKRFDPDSEHKKGKSNKNATDITGLFRWKGWVSDIALDTDMDGDVDIDDAPAGYSTVEEWLTDVQLFPPLFVDLTGGNPLDLPDSSEKPAHYADFQTWMVAMLPVNLDRATTTEDPPVPNGVIDQYDMPAGYTGTFDQWIVDRLGSTPVDIEPSGGDDDIDMADFWAANGPNADLNNDGDSNLTDLKYWLASVQNPTIDLNSDGQITAADLPANYPSLEAWLLDLYDKDNDGDIDQDDALTKEYTEYTWLFNIAEFVSYPQDVNNQGTKLLKIRFYPVATTTFMSKWDNLNGIKFNDVNGDGLWDPDGIDNITGNADDETGLAGWTMYVDYNANSTLDAGEPSDVTDSDGYYEIIGIDPGTWYVREVGQTDWSCTFPSACEYQVTFERGKGYSGYDFGNYNAP